MTLRTRLLLAATACWLALGVSPADEKDRAKAKEEAAAAEAARLEGEWTAAAGSRDGRALTKDELAKLSLTLTGPKAKQFFGNTTSLAGYLPEGEQNASAVSWAVNPEAAPREITFGRQYGFRVSYYPGIYELKGDTLTLCADFTPSPDGPPNRKRPAKFEAAKGSPYTLLTFARKKP